MGAPLSMAWEACACRSQCTEAAGLTLARLAAALTMKLTARSVRAWPGLRTDSNTGADAGRVSAAGQQAGGDDGGDQHLPDLVALADDFKLRLAAVTADDLGPGQRH